MSKNLSTKKAFTLTEAMIAVAILAIAAAGVILPFSGAAAIQAEGSRLTLAAKLASDLMERIINTPFEDIVSSFNGYSESQGQVKDSSGSVFPGSLYSKFRRNSSCSYVYFPDEDMRASPKFILATVKVYYKSDEVVEIVRLITR
jgi:prepilin-type N-terminal cleavage/methylation domain-containing protein